MQYEHAHLFRRISFQQLQYSRRDPETLRNSLRGVEFELPRGLIRTMKRQKLIDALLVNDFGTEVILDYKSFCAEDNRLKQFVEGKISVDDV